MTSPGVIAKHPIGAMLRQHWDKTVLALVLVLAGYLRVSRLELMEFKYDECRMHQLAVAQASGSWQFGGLMSSAGIHNPPTAVYLFSIAAFFTTDPLAMALAVALLNTAAVGLAYFLARMWLSKPAALGAALLFAASPSAVFLSRKIWAQDLLPFFTTAFFLLLVAWLRKGRGWQALGALSLLGVISTIHFSGLALLPIAAIVCVLKRGAPWKHVAAGLLVFVLIWAPFGVFLLRGGAEELAANEFGLGDEQTYLQRFTAAAVWQVRLMADGGARVLLGESTEEFTAIAGSGEWTAYALAALLAAGLATATLMAAKRRDEWALVLWMLLPMLLAGTHKVMYHYFAVCYPGQFVVAALAVDALIGAARRRLGRSLTLGLSLAALLFICAVCAGFVQFTRTFLALVDARGAIRGDYGTTYREKRTVAQYLAKEVPSGQFALLDCSGTRRSEGVIAYLYRRAGGRGDVLIQSPELPVPPVKAYVLIGPGAERMMPAALRDMRLRETVNSGKLEVQCWEPVVSGPQQ